MIHKFKTNIPLAVPLAIPPEILLASFAVSCTHWWTFWRPVELLCRDFNEISCAALSRNKQMRTVILPDLHCYHASIGSTKTDFVLQVSILRRPRSNASDTFGVVQAANPVFHRLSHIQ